MEFFLPCDSEFCYSCILNSVARISNLYREFRNSTGTHNSAHKLTLYPIRMIPSQDLSPPPRPSNPPRRLTEEWSLSRPPHPTGSDGSPPPPGPEFRDFRYTRGNLCSETPAKQARGTPRHQKPEVNAPPPTKRRVRERRQAWKCATAAQYRLPPRVCRGPQIPEIIAQGAREPLVHHRVASYASNEAESAGATFCPRCSYADSA
jgi:hypothetical protein